MLSFAEITEAFDNFHRQVWTFFDPHPSERGIETVGEGYLLDACYTETTGTFDNADCLIGGDDSYDCYDHLNDPRTCVTSKNNGPVKEEAVISDRDGMLYRYSADFAGVFGYDIYPLRDGRSFVKKIDHDAGDGELNIKFEHEADIGGGRRTYFLGPYKVIGDWEGHISQISLGEMPVSRDDPGFVDFMAHYNIDPAQEINLAAAEVYIRLLNECGGIDWKYSDDCLREIDKLKDLSHAVGYRVSNYNGDRTSVFSHIVDNAKFLVAGSEYGLSNWQQGINSYYHMIGDIDKIADLEVDVMVERFKAILGEDVYRQFAESFYLRVAEEQDDGIEKRDLFKRWLANKLMGISLCQPPAPFCPL